MKGTIATNEDPSLRGAIPRYSLRLRTQGLRQARVLLLAKHGVTVDLRSICPMVGSSRKRRRGPLHARNVRLKPSRLPDHGLDLPDHRYRMQTLHRQVDLYLRTVNHPPDPVRTTHATTLMPNLPLCLRPALTTVAFIQTV